MITVAFTTIGRAYGYLIAHGEPPGILAMLRMPPSPKRKGRCFTGSAKSPPRAIPATLPVLNMRGNNIKALARYFLSWTISAVIVLITLVFPFASPERHRQNINVPKLWEKPNPILASTLTNSPATITSFRP